MNRSGLRTRIEWLEKQCERLMGERDDAREEVSRLRAKYEGEGAREFLVYVSGDFANYGAGDVFAANTQEGMDQEVARPEYRSAADGLPGYVIRVREVKP